MFFSFSNSIEWVLIFWILVMCFCRLVRVLCSIGNLVRFLC